MPPKNEPTSKCGSDGHVQGPAVVTEVFGTIEVVDTTGEPLWVGPPVVDSAVAAEVDSVFAVCTVVVTATVVVVSTPVVALVSDVEATVDSVLCD